MDIPGKLNAMDRGRVACNTCAVRGTMGILTILEPEKTRKVGLIRSQGQDR